MSSSNSAQSPPYTTSELLASAYLKMQGLEHEVAKLGPNTAIIRFPNPPSSVLSMIDDFYSGRATYDPAAFNVARVELRKEIDVVLGRAK